MKKITVTELAELDQELFDKLFVDGSVKSVTELRNRIKEDAEKQFLAQGDQQLLNAVTEYLVENTKFELPAEFLTKMVSNSRRKRNDC